MHMLLILLALCLRRPNGISHLFSIAYAFAGNGWELSKTFAESVQLQAKYVSECCEFSNFLFSQMAEYLEWPRDQMAFAPDESAEIQESICNSNSVRLRDDGNIYFWALFTIIKSDNVNHRYQLIFPLKV